MVTTAARNLAATTLLVAIVTAVIGGLILLEVGEPIALASGVLVFALIKADDRRIRSNRAKAAHAASAC